MKTNTSSPPANSAAPKKRGFLARRLTSAQSALIAMISTSAALAQPPTASVAHASAGDARIRDRIRAFLRKPLNAALTAITRPAASIAHGASAPTAARSPLMQAIGHLFVSPEHAQLAHMNAENARLEAEIARLSQEEAALVGQRAVIKEQVVSMCAVFGLRREALNGKSRAEIHALLEAQCRQLAIEQAEALGFQISTPANRAACMTRGPNIAIGAGVTPGASSPIYPSS